METEEPKLEKRGYVAISANVKQLMSELAAYHKISEDELLAVALLRLENQDKLDYRRDYKAEWQKKKKEEKGVV